MVENRWKSVQNGRKSVKISQNRPQLVKNGQIRSKMAENRRKPVHNGQNRSKMGHIGPKSGKSENFPKLEILHFVTPAMAKEKKHFFGIF